MGGLEPSPRGQRKWPDFASRASADASAPRSYLETGVWVILRRQKQIVDRVFGHRHVRRRRPAATEFAADADIALALLHPSKLACRDRCPRRSRKAAPAAADHDKAASRPATPSAFASDERAQQMRHGRSAGMNVENDIMTRKKVRLEKPRQPWRRRAVWGARKRRFRSPPSSGEQRRAAITAGAFASGKMVTCSSHARRFKLADEPRQGQSHRYSSL